MAEKDTLWKAVIEDLVEDFLHFFIQNLRTKLIFPKDSPFSIKNWRNCHLSQIPQTAMQIS